MVTDRRKPENTEPPLTGRGDDGPKFKLAGTLAPVSPHPRSRSGPKTPKGKAAVAGNAIKHGIFARARVLPGVERPEEWEAHLNGVVADLAPDGDYVDTLLAEFAAVKFWALERVRRHGLAVLVRDQAQRDLELAQLVAKLAKQQGLPGWPVLELPDEARNRSLEHAKEQGFGSWWQLAALEEELRLAQVRRQPLDQLAKAGKSLPLEAAQNLLRALTDGEGLTGNRIPRAVQASTRPWNWCRLHVS